MDGFVKKNVFLLIWKIKDKVKISVFFMKMYYVIYVYELIILIEFLENLRCLFFVIFDLYYDIFFFVGVCYKKINC